MSDTVRYVPHRWYLLTSSSPRSAYAHTMSTTVEAVSERSAAEVNEAIRDLWLRSGGTLSVEQREEYRRLVLEWAAAAPQPSRAV